MKVRDAHSFCQKVEARGVSGVDVVGIEVAILGILYHTGLPGIVTAAQDVAVSLFTEQPGPSSNFLSPAVNPKCIGLNWNRVLGVIVIVSLCRAA